MRVHIPGLEPGNALIQEIKDSRCSLCVHAASLERSSLIFKIVLQLIRTCKQTPRLVFFGPEIFEFSSFEWDSG
jgi:hypothetical protein